MLYVLPTCSFTKEQCDELDKLIRPHLFNMHRIQRNYNRQVIYTSREHGGLHIYSTYHLQGISKLQFLFRHYRNEDTTGKLIISSMRFTQLKCGLSTPYYMTDYNKHHNLVTPTWATHIWKYCSDCKVQMRESAPWIYQLPRCNDFFLMDIVALSEITMEHKEIFNRVRLNLKLLTASDIIKAHRGAEILPNILKGESKRTSTLNWPQVADIPKQ